MSDLGFTQQRLIEVLRRARNDGATDLQIKVDQRVQTTLHRHPRNLDVSLTATEIQWAHDHWLPPEERALVAKGRNVYTNVPTDVGVGMVRMTAGHDVRGPYVDFRLQPPAPLELSALGLPESIRDVWRLRTGLVLIAAPPGEGKTTLSHAYLNEINKHDVRHIVTVEWPPEFIHDQIQSLFSQHHLGGGADVEEIALSLRRRHVNVAYIAELMDLPWLNATLIAAQVCLTFATIHASQTPGAIEDFIERFDQGEKEQIRVWMAGHLNCVVGMRLLPRADRPGVVVATELLKNVGNVRPHILAADYAGLNADIQLGKQHGMHELEESLANLVGDGVVREADALQHVTRPGRFEGALKAQRDRGATANGAARGIRG